MDLTARVRQFMLSKEGREQPHSFFTQPHCVIWLEQLERLIQLQYLHKFDRATGRRVALVRRGKSFWHAIHSMKQIQPGAALYLPPQLREPCHATAAPFIVLAVRHTPFRVSMTVLWHPTSGTLVTTLTGLRARSIGVGAAVTCHTGLTAFSKVCQDHAKGATPATPRLARAKVHAGLVSLLHHFTHSKAWSTLVQAAQHKRVKNIVFAGFSLGGSMTHLLSQLLRAATGGRHAPMVVVVEGAPRTGDPTWASAFTERSSSFAHLNLVSAARMHAETGAVQADEVTTIPLAASGFKSCLPLVAVVDGQGVFQNQRNNHKTPPPMAFDAHELSTRNLWNLTGRLNLCLASVNFMKGFSHMHKLVLQ